MGKRVLCFLLCAGLMVAAASGERADYVGGTMAGFARRVAGRLIATDPAILRFEAGSQRVEVPYSRIHTLEYGQKVDRRYVSAVLISPLFLLAKSRKHFLTIGFTDAQGQEQALVFQVHKKGVRAVLVSLEARTGRKVTFQDDEARKAGRG